MSTDPYYCRGCGATITARDGVCCTINVCAQCGSDCADTTYSRRADEHFCCLCIKGIAPKGWQPPCRMCEAREKRERLRRHLETLTVTELVSEVRHRMSCNHFRRVLIEALMLRDDTTIDAMLAGFEDKADE